MALRLHGYYSGEGVTKHAAVRIENPQEVKLVHIEKADSTILYYVFGYPEGGFAIIGGNDVAREVLGYSSEGYFDLASMPEGLFELLLSYKVQIASALTMGDEPQSRSSKSIRTDVAPMIETKWGQGEPFNSAIPTPSGIDKSFVTGCNATASAQLMYYYKYPTKGIGSHAYQVSYDGGVSATYAADFDAATYDWGQMLTDYSSGYTADQAKAVSTLMYHLGVAMDMQYNERQPGSSSLTYAGGKALTQYFGYDKGATFEQRRYYDDEEWEQMIYDELKSGHPILYGGQSAFSGGHAFVCHGYDAATDCFCINWGWNGNYDGYFPLTGVNALSPKGTGAEGGTAYTNDQYAFIGLVPDKGTADYKPVVAFKGEVSLIDEGEEATIDRESAGDVELQIDSSVRSFINGGYMNPGRDIFIGVMLEDVDTGRQYTQKTLIPLTFDTSLAPCTGTYRVYPAYRFRESEPWRKMLVEKQYRIPTVTIRNGYGDYNQDGHVSIADLMSVLSSGDGASISKLINLLLQRE